MYKFNQTGAIFQSMKRWCKEKPNDSILKWLLFYIVLTVVGVNILISWNTVPVRDDYITIEKEFLGSDSASFDINITNDYYSFGNNIKSDNGTSVSIKAPQRNFLGFILADKNKEDSLRDFVTESTKGRLSLDSLSGIYRVDIKRNIGDVSNNPFTWWVTHKKDTTIQTFYNDDSFTQLVDTAPAYRSAFEKVYSTLHFRFCVGKKGLTAPNEFKYKYTKRPPRCLASEDISQMYYILNANIPGKYSSISITIDFVGVVEFSSIYPEPDITTMSSITYNDQNKIDIIKNKGVRMYCQFPDTVNLQTVRVFLLTTIISITIAQIFNYSWRTIRFTWKRYRKKKEDEKKDNAPD